MELCLRDRYKIGLILFPLQDFEILPAGRPDDKDGTDDEEDAPLLSLLVSVDLMAPNSAAAEACLPCRMR